MKRLLLFTVFLSLCLFVGACGRGGAGKKDVTPMPSQDEINQMMKAQGQPPAQTPPPAAPKK